MGTGRDNCLRELIAQTLEHDALISRGSRAVVAVSGGADSVALLHVLCSLACERDFEVVAAHLDHALRDTSAGDARFVMQLARSLGADCVIRRAAVRSFSDASRQGIEAAARDLRYSFLRRVAFQTGASVVATAHHADDQVETVLFRILRGTHLKGLAGIPRRRDLGGGVQLVRPMLEATHAQAVAYCHRHGLCWREDHTNNDTTYARNYLRHRLLPELRRDLNPSVDRALLKLSALAGDLACRLEAEAGVMADQRISRAGESWEIDLVGLEHADPGVRGMFWRQAMIRAGLPMGKVTRRHFGWLEGMLSGDPQRSRTFPGGWQVCREGWRLSMVPGGSEASEGLQEAIALPVPGRVKLPAGGWISCQAELLDRPVTPAQARAAWDRGEQWLDAGRVFGSLEIRPRRDGDSFVPLGSPGTQSVSDFLTNAKLSVPQRERVVCVCDGEGIVYVVPLRISQRVRVLPGTRRLLKIRCSA